MSLKKIKVLLIDDDEEDYILTKELLSQIPKHRYELSWINNFEQGVTAAVKKQADIYLVDYSLGAKTGLDLMREAIQSNIKEPFIILTGKGDYAIDEQALNIGAADYLVKGDIEPISLDRTLRYALRQAETMRALRESENKFRIIFERAKDTILISDYTGKIHDINQAGLSLFGYSVSEILQTNDREIFLNLNDREEFIQSLETKGALSDFECQMLTKDGRILFCRLSSFLQIDTTNMTEVYHTIIHDISSKRNSEHQDSQQASTNVKEKLVHRFADDIRSELSLAHMTFYELSILPTILGNGQAQMLLDELKISCEKINSLTENYLIASTSKSVFNTHSINNLINELANEYDLVFRSENIQLDLNILPAETKVKMERSKIKEALGHILKNAVESLSTEPRIISISTFSDSGFYSILIEDNGVGIAFENRAKIFAPEFTTKIGADGMGLADAQKIILEHNGSIEYKQAENGSLFIVTLPIVN